jgi:hypothetical protein
LWLLGLALLLAGIVLLGSSLYGRYLDKERGAHPDFDWERIEK